jgi:hypothetical protein
MRGPSMKNLILTSAVLSFLTSTAFAGRPLTQDEVDRQIEKYKDVNVEQPTYTGGVAPDVMPSYQAPTGVTQKTTTIQDAAAQSKAKNSGGEDLGKAAMMVTTGGVAATCFTTAPNCPYWIAGLAASTVVTMFMGSAKDKSDKTLKAVTVGDGSGPGGDVIPSYTDTPQFQAAQDMLKKVGKLGYQVDLKTGNVKAPNGKTYNANDFGNSAAMQAAGMSSSEIGAANAFNRNLKAAIDKQLKAAGADAGGDMFGDAGGGGGSATKGAEGGALPDGYLAGIPGKDSQGDRGPAQVAGLQKNLDGTPIGISQDNLFSMIGKRYQWCSNKGCFLPTVKP